VDNAKRDHRLVRWGDDWIGLVQDKDQWKSFAAQNGVRCLEAFDIVMKTSMRIATGESNPEP
jgi:hypothetical protein